MYLHKAPSYYSFQLRGTGQTPGSPVFGRDSGLAPPPPPSSFPSSTHQYLDGVIKKPRALSLSPVAETSPPPGLSKMLCYLPLALVLGKVTLSVVETLFFFAKGKESDSSIWVTTLLFPGAKSIGAVWDIIQRDLSALTHSSFLVFLAQQDTWETFTIERGLDLRERRSR